MAAWPWHIEVYSTDDMRNLTGAISRAANEGSDWFDSEAKALHRRLVRQLIKEGLEERSIMGSSAVRSARKVTRQMEHASDLLLDVSRAMHLAYRNWNKYIADPIRDARRERAHPSRDSIKV